MVDDDRKQVAWLERRLALDRRAVGKILTRRPSLFRAKIDTVETKLVWLREVLGLEEPDIGRVIHGLPNILG